MAWRTKCDECGQDAPITRPHYAKQSLLENGDLGLAIATYEALPRRPTDSRSVLRRWHHGSAVSDAQRPLDDTR